VRVRPATLLFRPPEAGHRPAQPAPDLLARVRGDLANCVVGLDDPELIIARAPRPPTGHCLCGLRAIARTACLGGVDLRLRAGDGVVWIWRGSGCVGIVGHETHSRIYLPASVVSAASTRPSYGRGAGSNPAGGSSARP